MNDLERDRVIRCPEEILVEARDEGPAPVLDCVEDDLAFSRVSEEEVAGLGAEEYSRSGEGLRRVCPD